MLAIGLLVLIVLIVLIWFALRSGSSRVTPIPPDDPLWVQAIERARASAETMKQLHEAGHEVWVKFPLTVADGTTEHVWGRLVTVQGTSLRCTIETPPVGGSGPSDGMFETDVRAFEDWQVVLPDGSIRGGYTTRAQARIAEREGHPVPRHVREMLSRMTD